MGNRCSSDSDCDKCTGECWGAEIPSDYEDDGSGKCLCHRRTPPPKITRPFELRYNGENSDHELDVEFSRNDFTDSGSFLKTKCEWYISDFSESDVHKEKGSIRSNVYVGGIRNQFQYFFIMDKIVQPDDIYYGVYVCVLSNIAGQATVYYKTYLEAYRQSKHKLPLREKQFKHPRKPGCRFLGFLKKDRIWEDGYFMERMVPDDTLTLICKINVQYKKWEHFAELERLIVANRENDITLVVRGVQFPANKKILSGRSSTFAKLLAKHNDKELQIDDIEPEVMKQILKFIYTGKVTKLFKYTPQILIAANKYKLKELQSICKKVQAVQ